MARSLALAALALSILLPTFAQSSGAGAFAGPSSYESDGMPGGSCQESGAAAVTIHPDGADGWAFDAVFVAPPGGCSGLGLAFGWWPSFEFAGLVGSPATGFRGNGTYDWFGTGGEIDRWSLETGPIGVAGTPWTLDVTSDLRYAGEVSSSTHGVALLGGAST